MSSKSRSRGKRNEKETAKLLKARRLGTLGAVDVLGEYAVECKSSEDKYIPKWFKKMWAQAVRHAEKEKKPPVVQLHKHGQRRANDWIILRLKDFVKLLEKSRPDDDK
ncbi:MAG: hypothetical protein GWN17_09900 [Candidatus Korarchaeota archaeon]|nr:hypothetical protein [Candidatus Korarchaeota archaeon]